MFALAPVLLCLVASALARHDNHCSSDSMQNNDNDEQFSNYVKAFGKQYCDDEEYYLRKLLFQKSLNTIRELRRQHPETRFDVNHMSDWTEEERQKLRGFRADYTRISNKTFKYVPKGEASASLDWRQKNAVTPIKDQAQCGSCYIFSAIGCIEGAYAKKHGELLRLSEQQALDCDAEDGGCGGGLPHIVMNQLHAQGGSQEESSYRAYQAEKGQCSTDSSLIKVKVKGGMQLDVDSEDSLADAVANLGPLSIAMNFASDQLAYYSGGYLDPTDCDPEANPDHALTLVGFGATDDNKPYWIIKNSWGTIWGDSGYLYLARGKGGKGACGILDYVASAEVE